MPPGESRVSGIDWNELTLIPFSVPGEQLCVPQPGSPVGILSLGLRTPSGQGTVARSLFFFSRWVVWPNHQTVWRYSMTVDGLVPVQGEVGNQPDSSGGPGRQNCRDRRGP